ncbi:MAG: leucine-rich repeat protein, partial [Clostridia bacterium]|nr:leucine-rich repeat protein [Clostridia bacterium]
MNNHLQNGRKTALGSRILSMLLALVMLAATLIAVPVTALSEPYEGSLEEAISERLDELYCVAHGKLDLVFGTSDTICPEDPSTMEPGTRGLEVTLSEIFGYPATISDDELEYVRSDYAYLGDGQTAWPDTIVTFTNPETGSEYDIDMDLALYKAVGGMYCGAVVDHGFLGCCPEDWTNEATTAKRAVMDNNDDYSPDFWNEEDEFVIPGEEYTEEAIEAWLRGVTGLGDGWDFYIEGFDASQAYEGNAVHVGLMNNDINEEGRTVVICCSPTLKIAETEEEGTIMSEIDDRYDELACITHGKLDLAFGPTDTLDKLADVLSGIFGYAAAVDASEIQRIKNDYFGFGSGETAWVDEVEVTFTNPDTGATYEMAMDMAFLKNLFGKYSGAVSDDEAGTLTVCQDDLPDDVNAALATVAPFNDEYVITLYGSEYTEEAVEEYFRDLLGLGDDWDFYVDGFDADAAADGNDVAIGFRNDDVNGEGRTYVIGFEVVLKFEPGPDPDPDGYFVYEISDGTATVTGYNGPGGDVSIPAELGGYPVTGIGSNAFKGCKTLTGITVPAGITNIGSWAFSGCTALEVLSLGGGVKSIGSYAFSNCTSLTYVDFPDSVTSIGYDAFYSCTSLAGIGYPVNWTSVPTGYNGGPFEGCTSLTSVSIPDGVTSVPAYAFSDCSVLTSVEIPDSVTSIGSDAFENCTSLSSVTIPDSVTSIGSYAFRGCTALEVLSLGEGLESIGSYAFSNCTSLTYVDFPDSVKSIGYNAFYGCTSLAGIGYPVNWTSVPTGYNGGPFEGCTSLTSVAIPDGVTSVPAYAFSDCGVLASVEIPDSVTSIGSNAFRGCTALEVLSLGENVGSIGSNAFRDCTSLTYVDFPDSVTSIGYNAFYGCTSLAGIGYPVNWSSVPTGYNGGPFAGCTSLTSVAIPDGVTSVPAYAFRDCDGLTSVEIPDSVTNIGNYAFENCTSLSSATIPGSVKSIGNYAFEDCTSLTSVSISVQKNVKVFEYGDHLYALFINPVTWDRANLFCSGLGGHLATVSSAGENQIIAGAIKNSGLTGALIGGNDIDEEGVWEWVTGEEWTYSNWDSGEPNDDGQGGQNIAWIYSGNGKWDDERESFEFPALVCEWESADAILISRTVCEPVYEECKNTFGIHVESSAFYGCDSLADVYFSGTEELWSVYLIDDDNDPLLDAEFHFGHTHVFGETEIELQPTCARTGRKYRECAECGLREYSSINKLPHEYGQTVVSPTYTEGGYTVYTCSACGNTYIDDFTDPLERTPVSDCVITLIPSVCYYAGAELTPGIRIEYASEIIDPENEFSITYSDNDRVGTAYVTVEGINRFCGSVTVPFEIVYETVPEQIVNVTAIGETNGISLSWSVSSEVTTDEYRIYRKAAGESEYTLVGTVIGRDNLSYTDYSVENGEVYSYYVTGVGLYGAESEPSAAVECITGADREKPVVTKLWPASNTRIGGVYTLTVEASDNVAVTSALYEASTDGVNWAEIGFGDVYPFSVDFDTAAFADGTINVRVTVFDGAGNESDPLSRVYTLDNTAPAKVLNLSVVSVYSNKLTLTWDDSEEADRTSYEVQMLKDGEFTTVDTVRTIGYNALDLVPETEYVFRVACVDLAGNRGEWSDSLSVATDRDDTPPTVTSLRPFPRAVNSNFSFSATVSDSSGVASASIQASTDLEEWTTVYSVAFDVIRSTCDVSYTVPTADYPEGYLYLRCVAVDVYGNKSADDALAPYNGYLIDRTAPDVPTDVRAEGNNGYITISWTQGSEDGLSYSVYRSNSETGVYSPIASSLNTISYHDRSVLIDREYWYRVAVTDNCGNVSGLSAPVSGRTAADSENPVVNSFSQVYNNCLSEKYSSLSVLATDNSRLNYVQVEYSVNDGEDYSLIARENSIGDYSAVVSFEVPVGDLSDGDRVLLRALAVDEAGLMSSYLTSEYTVDKSAPSVNELTVLPDEGGCVLTWKDNGEEDLSGFRVYRSTDGADYESIGSRSRSADGNYTFTDILNEYEEHFYSYRIGGIDKLGNEGGEIVSLEYGSYLNTAPVIAASVPSYMEIGVERYFDATNSTDNGSIASCLWNFGDGTESTSLKPVKKYSEEGTYTVTLTLTDNEGASSSSRWTVSVRERNTLGVLSVRVVDDNYCALSDAKVLIDKGLETEIAVYTDGNGVASVSLPSGEHEIAAYLDSHHLPAKKTTSVLSNATRSVTLILVEEELVTGEFEITRMNLDEIIAAGIDVYDPANQQIYRVNVRVVYGGAPLNISYQRNNYTILSYCITDSNGTPVSNVRDSSGDSRILIPQVISCGEENDIIAILDIPAQASYLKEFFDVKLYITNHASSDFVITGNEVCLNVPEGMTLMSGLSGYEDSAEVSFPELAGQETKVLRWCLRGDDEGEYRISADYTGILDYFNEFISARFEADEDIKVYGLNGVEFSILACDEIHNGAFYFKLGLKNTRPIDLYMPKLSIADSIENVTESVLNDNPDGDFVVQQYLLNAYIESPSGEKIYLPLYHSSSGYYAPEVRELAPGQSLVYEYVCYNAIKSDDVGYFQSAVKDVLSGYAENVVVGSYTRERYSFLNVTHKMDRIVARDDEETTSAYDYIMNDDNFYYVSEARDQWNGVLDGIYRTLDLALEFDLEGLTGDEARSTVRDVLMKILLDEDTLAAIEDNVELKYIEEVKENVKFVKDALSAGYNISKDDVDSLVKLEAEDFSSLASTLMNDGKEEAMKKLYLIIAKNMVGYGLANDPVGFYEDIGVSKDSIFSFNSVGSALKNLSRDVISVLEAADATLERSYIYSALYANASEEYSEFILNSISDYCTANVGEADDVMSAVIDVVSEFKTAIRKDAESREQVYDMLKNSFTQNIAIDVVKNLAKDCVKKALGTPYAIAGSVWKVVDSYFAFGELAKAYDTMRIYDLVGSALSLKIRSYVAGGERTNEDDLNAMAMLNALCEVRLDGESQYNSAVTMYVDREFGHSITEEDAINRIYSVKGEYFPDLETWYDTLRFNILDSRDVIFNRESSSSIEIPPAPEVTLDYENNQTDQAFSDKYEYCFANGEWIPCTGEQISFTPGSTPSVLRVRQAATDSTLAGKTKTVTIFAQRSLSGLITVKYDGGAYLIDNLTGGRQYQVVFTNDETVNPVWDGASEFTADNSGNASVSLGEQYGYAIIRSTVYPEGEETYSVPLTRNVAARVKLPLTVVGAGSYTQDREDGMYFVGEEVTITALPAAGAVIDGWYVDGVRVGADAVYVFEIGTANSIELRFKSAHIAALTVTRMPDKLSYSEDEAPDLAGLVLTVTFEDGRDGEVVPDDSTLTKKENGDWVIRLIYDGASVDIPVSVSHVNGDWVVTMEPGCTSEGEKVMHCVICGEVISVSAIPALGHDYVNTVITPKCTSKGYTRHRCTRCGDSYVDSYTAALGHDFGDWVVTTGPSCTEAGEETGYCSRCDATETRTVDLLGHDFGEWTVTTGPTCTQPGSEERSCSRCDMVETKPIDALDHDYVNTVITPKCTSKGYTRHRCTRCGDSYVDSYTPALGHDFGDWVVTTGPSCTEAGEETRYCSRCDATETRIVDPLGHNYSDYVIAPKCKAKGYTRHKCTRCGDNYVDTYTDALGHDFGEWTVTTDPTCTEAGEETRYCSRCDATETQAVPPLGHDYQLTVSGEYVCSRCGDTYNVESDYEYTVTDGEVTITKYLGSDADVIIPSHIEGSPVTVIGPKSFTQCDSLVSVVVPDTVTEIVYEAFSFCNSLSSVTLPDSVTSLGEGLFGYCSSLVSVEIPNGVTSIEDSTFSHCSLLESVTIPETVTHIGFCAFEYCTSLTEITVPASVSSIDELPFVGCDSLTDIYFGGTRDVWDGFGLTYLPEGVTVHCYGDYVLTVDSTRGGVMYLLWWLAGSPEPVSTVNRYQDLSPDAYYYDAVLWALENNITTGLSSSLFGPDVKCSKSQIVQFIWRSMGSPEPYGSTNPFGDVSENLWCYKSALWSTEQTFFDFDISDGMYHPYNEVCSVSANTAHDSTAFTFFFDHSFSGWITVSENSCSEGGSEKRVCTRCDAVETRQTDPLGHNYVVFETVEPTCTERGFTTHICTRCGDNYVDTYTDALGHDFGDWVVTTGPGCTEAGEETRYCSRCDASETRAVDPLGHNYSDYVIAPKCKAKGYTRH